MVEGPLRTFLLSRNKMWKSSNILIKNIYFNSTILKFSYRYNSNVLTKYNIDYLCKTHKKKINNNYNLNINKLEICRYFSYKSKDLDKNENSKQSMTRIFLPLPITSSSEEEECLGTDIVGNLKKDIVRSLLTKFYKDENIKDLSKGKGLDSYLYEETFDSFKKFCLKGEPIPTDLHIVLHDLSRGSGHIHDIYPFFIRHAQKVFPHLKCMNELSKISDLTTPSEWQVLLDILLILFVGYASP